MRAGCALILSALLFEPLSAEQPRKSSEVTAAQKREFISLIRTLPHEGDFFTSEAADKAEAYLPVLLALTAADLEKEDVFRYAALSRSFGEKPANRTYVLQHFDEVKHPLLRLGWSVILFDANLTSPELLRFLRDAFNSPQQTTLLMDILGPEFQTFKKRVLASAKRKEILADFSAKELVHRYVRTNPSCAECRKSIEEALQTKDPNQVFESIAVTVDRYDPRTFWGRMPNRVENAYWALGLLVVIDHNQIRARGVEGGRKALESYAKMLEKKKVAGYINGKNHELQTRYEAETSQYRSLKGANEQDFRISMQLKEEYGVELSGDELCLFSDFLVAKDPRYVSWSKASIIGLKPLRYRFLDVRSYYEAYLDFRKSNPAKPYSKLAGGADER